MIGATAYNIPLLQGGQSVPRIVDVAVERPLRDADLHACVEHHEGKSILVTSMYVCQQSGCRSCFLAQIRCLEYCPWHNPDHFDCRHLVHFVCVQGDNGSIIRIFGWLGPFLDQWMFSIFPTKFAPFPQPYQTGGIRASDLKAPSLNCLVVHPPDPPKIQNAESKIQNSPIQNPNFFGRISGILDFGSLCSIPLREAPTAPNFGFWISDFGFWISDFGFRILDFGLWSLM